MTVTLEQAASTYLDDIAESAGVGYIEAYGITLLVNNIGMWPKDAAEVVNEWLKKREEKA